MPKANAQAALGLFSEPSYLSNGDPYDPPETKDVSACHLPPDATNRQPD